MLEATKCKDWRKSEEEKIHVQLWARYLGEHSLKAKPATNSKTGCYSKGSHHSWSHWRALELTQGPLELWSSTQGQPAANFSLVFAFIHDLRHSPWPLWLSTPLGGDLSTWQGWRDVQHLQIASCTPLGSVLHTRQIQNLFLPGTLQENRAFVIKSHEGKREHELFCREQLCNCFILYLVWQQRFAVCEEILFPPHILGRCNITVISGLKFDLWFSTTEEIMLFDPVTTFRVMQSA